MKTKGLNKTKVNIVTLGCAKNLVDSEVLLTQLKGNQIDATHESDKDEASVVVINTCGFIESAKQESIDTILRYADAKDQGLIKKLYVTGCLSHRYKHDLAREIPTVDAFFGTNELPNLLRKFKADYKHELVGERVYTSDKHFAYLKISEGCDRPCSFCAIPLMRGKHKSKPMDELLLEAKSLASKGVKELILIAQDSTYYGLDLYKKRNLAELLESLTLIEGIEWIRIHYAFPSGFPVDILDVMSDHPKICNYLDIPLQHGSDKMLTIMRRGITRAKTQKLLDLMRSKVPDIAIRTTLIAGHPGETESEFAELLDFVEENKFERLGVFTYSHEEDTHSYSMADSVPQQVKQDRANAVMELQEEISDQLNQNKVGKSFKTLIDRIEGDYYIGRTEHDSPEVDNEVLIKSEDHLSVGDFVSVKITQATAFDLYGEPEIML